MGQKSKIEWTDRTWNPVSGCSHVSEGCRNCYAERLFPRPYPGRAFTDVQCHPERLDQPLHWKKPSKIFVNSMSDLFHEDVPESFIAQVFQTMNTAEQHTFQILTKRPKRMLEFSLKCQARSTVEGSWPMPNVWLGVSVEDQKTADERVPMLMSTPAAVRFVSYEPALGPVDFTNLNDGTLDALDGFDREAIGNICDPGFLSETQHPPNLDWVIVGGESGPQARPMHPDWVRKVRDDCQAAGVPFFFKQWGEWAPAIMFGDGLPNGGACQIFEERMIHADGSECIHDICNKSNGMLRTNKKYSGRLLDGREWNEFPDIRRLYVG